MSLIVILVIGLIMGSVCAGIASNRGRSAGGYFALGFFLGLIGLVITLCVTHGSRRYSDGYTVR